MNSDVTTVNLIAEVKDGQPVLENLLVQALGENRYRLLRSPGLVPGMAAGDEFEMTPTERHGYRLLKRGGNVCVQLFLPGDPSRCRDTLLPLLRRLGGQLDGEVNTSTSGLLVFTIPVAVGFPAMEDLMRKATALCPGCEWFYGNVYDLDHPEEPLNWWL